MRVLLIDDNKDITKMLGTYFSLLGHSCMSTNDGHDAFLLIQKNEFDLILLDLAMPGFSGYDLIAMLEQNNLIKNNHIVVLTASSISSINIKQIHRAGIKTILKKPLDPDEILLRCAKR